MSVHVRSAVTIEDDGDHASITVELRDDAGVDLERWCIRPSGGGTTVFVADADLIEFASAVRALVEDA